MERLNRSVWAALLVGLTAAAMGCGTPGAPQPPSLNLPERVSDLAAVRTGNQVAITWTMSRRNTDKLLMKENVSVDICRQEGKGSCIPVAQIVLPPAKQGTFLDQLPPALAAGSARTLSYFVELKNHKGRSAGLSNGAAVLAGTAPAPVLGLTAEIHRDGIALHWVSSPLSDQQEGSLFYAVRLHRKRLSDPTESKPKGQTGPLATPVEPSERNLLVDSGAQVDGGRALDKDVPFHQTYEYSAQRIIRIKAGAQTLELAGAFSAPVRIEARDIFPPSVPIGLAAVASAAQADSAQIAGIPARSRSSIDLSWQPCGDSNLAGYVVYRREAEGAWQRISPTQPLPIPAFHDPDVLPGHTYRYAVTSVSEGNYESARSIETEETVPAQQ